MYAKCLNVLSKRRFGFSPDRSKESAKGGVFFTGEKHHVHVLIDSFGLMFDSYEAEWTSAPRSSGKLVSKLCATFPLPTIEKVRFQPSNRALEDTIMCTASCDLETCQENREPYDPFEHQNLTTFGWKKKCSAVGCSNECAISSLQKSAVQLVQCKVNLCKSCRYHARGLSPPSFPIRVPDPEMYQDHRENGELVYH